MSVANATIRIDIKILKKHNMSNDQQLLYNWEETGIRHGFR